jgi:hypothetical protein
MGSGLKVNRITKEKSSHSVQMKRQSLIGSKATQKEVRLQRIHGQGIILLENDQADVGSHQDHDGSGKRRSLGGVSRIPHFQQ